MEKRLNCFDEIEQIYKEYYPYIMKFLLRLTSDRQLCEDILQDVFSKLISHPEHLLEVKSLKSWLVKSSKNKLIDYFRKNKPFLIEDKQLIDELIGHNFSLETMITEKNRIKEILDKLAIEEKAIIISKDYYGYTYEEIGEMFDISLQNVKSRLFRARKSFVKYYSEVNLDE